MRKTYNKPTTYNKTPFCLTEECRRQGIAKAPGRPVCNDCNKSRQRAWNARKRDAVASNSPAVEVKDSNDGESGNEDEASGEYDEEIDMYMSTCISCGHGGDLVCCNSCTRVWHVECVGFVPRDEWNCEWCTQAGERDKGPSMTAPCTQTLWESVRALCALAPSGHPLSIIGSKLHAIGHMRAVCAAKGIDVAFVDGKMRVRVVCMCVCMCASVCVCVCVYVCVHMSVRM
jgi:hypothetical protein